MVVLESILNLSSGIALIAYGVYNFSKFRGIKSKELLSGFLAFMGLYGVLEFLKINSGTIPEAGSYMFNSILLLAASFSFFLITCIEIYNKSSRKYRYLPVISVLVTILLINWIEVESIGTNYGYRLNLAWALWLLVIVIFQCLLGVAFLIKLRGKTTERMKRKIDIFSIAMGTTSIAGVAHYVFIFPITGVSLTSVIAAVGFFIASSAFYGE